MGKDKHIQRFPRLPEQYPDAALRMGLVPRTGKTARIKVQLDHGYVPRGYDRLSRKQKKMAKRVASGMAIRDACRLTHVKSESFYRWINLHPLFKKYFQKQAMHYAMKVESRLDGKLPRAVQIIEDTLESRDPYHAHEAAVQLLKGRGKLKTSIQSQSKTESVSHIHVDGSLKTPPVNEKVALMFVDAMVRMSQGGNLKELKPKVIDIKSLPPATLEKLSGSEEVQKDKQGAAVGKDK